MEKKLCQKHEKERKQRADKYFSKPCCIYCGTQHTDLKDDMNQPRCKTCENEHLEIQQERQRTENILKVLKEELDACESVEDLKNYIWDYCIDKRQ